MKKSTASARTDSYVRSPDFADHIAGICFPPEVWAVFAQCEVPRTTAEIARRARVDAPTVGAALRRLARRGLVCKNQLDWQSYLNTRGAPATDLAPQPTPEPVLAAPPPTLAPVSTPAATLPAPQAVPAPASPPLAVIAASATPASTTIAPSPASSGASAATPLEFVLTNTKAAGARRSAAREVLSFSIGKTSSRRSAVVLAA